MAAHNPDWLDAKYSEQVKHSAKAAKYKAPAHDAKAGYVKTVYSALPLRLGGRAAGLEKVRVTFGGDRRVTEADIKAASDALALRNRGKRMQVSTFSTVHGWQSGKTYAGGNDPLLWNPHDYYADLDEDPENYPYLQNATEAGTVTAFEIRTLS
jgi:hypothetical protein